MPYQIVSNTNDITFRVNGQDALVVNKNGLITTPITTRQTVELGTVDSNGFSAFGGSTGSTTVTTATTLYLNAANGMVNRRGSITNPSWTGLSTNGTMYLYLDIAADGTCTSGSGTLVPVYQHGGTYSTTSNQFTFNIQEMTGKVGNGSTAAQTYRVYVGEVAVAGGLVTAITWYALMGRYDSGYTNTLPAANTTISKSHNIGIGNETAAVSFKCLTAEQAFLVGDVVNNPGNLNGTYADPINPITTRLTCVFGSDAAGFAVSRHRGSGFSSFNPTAANWAYRITAQRGW